MEHRPVTAEQCERHEPAVVECYRKKGDGGRDQYTFWCDPCMEWHLHGPLDGHRVEHCWHPSSPHIDRGYVLRCVGDLTPEREKNFAGSATMARLAEYLAKVTRTSTALARGAVGLGSGGRSTNVVVMALKNAGFKKSTDGTWERSSSIPVEAQPTIPAELSDHGWRRDPKAVAKMHICHALEMVTTDEAIDIIAGMTNNDPMDGEF